MGSQQVIARESKSPRMGHPGTYKGGWKDPAALVSTLSPVVSVVVAVVVSIAAIAVGIVGLAVSALVAFAVLVFVAALVAHPVLVAARTLPVVVLEFEAVGALSIGLPDAKAVTIRRRSDALRLHRAHLFWVTRVRGWISAGNCKAHHSGHRGR